MYNQQKPSVLCDACTVATLMHAALQKVHSDVLGDVRAAQAVRCYTDNRLFSQRDGTSHTPDARSAIRHQKTDTAAPGMYHAAAAAPIRTPNPESEARTPNGKHRTSQPTVCCTFTGATGQAPLRRQPTMLQSPHDQTSCMGLLQ